MDGESWALKSAVHGSFFSDSDSFAVDLYGGDDTYGCDDLARTPTAPMLMVNIPKEEGQHQLKFDLFSSDNLTMTLVPGPGENIILSQGILEVESVTDTSIRAGMYVTDGEGKYEFNGWFDVTLCPDK